MDVPHSANLKPSWYGESVGHYEGATLVIDTIGLNDTTVVDVYRTPHTEKLHVVERWRMTDGGKMMEATFTVEDPDTFYQPWSGMRRYRRAEDTVGLLLHAIVHSAGIQDRDGGILLLATMKGLFPLPPSRQGLGKSQPQRPRLLETGFHPPHAPKAL
jgi:hypothetical protein